MDSRARWRLAAETLLWAAGIGFVVFAIVMVGSHPANLRFAFQQELIRSLFLPTLIPVGGACIAMVVSPGWASWPKVILSGTAAWLLYLVALVLWIMSIEDGLGQSYAAILLLPWILSWLLIPTGYGIASHWSAKRDLRR